MGPAITPAMRAARNDELAERRVDPREDFMACAQDGPCSGVVGPHRSHTFYKDEASNWHLLCDAHAAENDDYWNERWDEYRASVW